MTAPNSGNRPCACGSYSILVKLSETPTESVWQRQTTDCTSTTQSTYAQGHDAKLRRFLVQAGINGHQIHRTDGNIVVIKDVMKVAAELGWDSAVHEGIERGKATS